MASLRAGLFGTYYGSTWGSSEALTTEQMRINATYIASYLQAQGWTLNAIAGMLGNLQVESSLNPGRWQSDDVGNTSMGYGLVQWTPSTNYTNWCDEMGYSDPSEMDNNLGRILYEYDNGLQYYPTDDYPMTFEEFAHSKEDPDYLCVVFLKNYERAGIEHLVTRQACALSWFEYLGGTTPTPTPTIKKKGNFNFILFNKNRRTYGQRRIFR